MEYGSDILRAPIFGDLDVTHGFSTRLGGVSEGPYAWNNMYDRRGDNPDSVAKNKRNFLKSLNISALATVDQVHGDQVMYVSEPGEMLEQADALVTTVPGLGVGVYTADCTPVLLAAPGVVAAVHSGWRGTAANIAARAVEAMVRAGTTPDQIRAAIGPAIGACCYEVGPEVADVFVDQGFVRFVLGGARKPHLDLKGIIESQLTAAGVTPQNIWTTDYCTYCDEGLFYSYRRTGWPTGQMLSVIALRDT